MTVRSPIGAGFAVSVKVAAIPSVTGESTAAMETTGSALMVTVKSMVSVLPSLSVTV